MNWILTAVVLLLSHKEYMASPSPLKMPGHTSKISPYIRHWEAASFDRTQLLEASRKHSEQKRHRRKRDLNSGEYGPSHTIKLNFFAHDREFRLILRQNPLSVFAADVEIENTLGPMDYDISRIYTGSLEDDENSHVHAILTNDNLLDGTIETSSEQFYVEPSHRYSRDLPESGIHSIVYKVTDVDMQKSVPPTKLASAEHCASERLRRSMLLNDLKRRKGTTKFERSVDGGSGGGGGGGGDGVGRQTGIEITNHREGASRKNHNNEMSANAEYSALQQDTTEENPHSRRPEDDVSISHNRRKRWLEDELTSSDDHQNPPLPLDLDVPYNDDFSVYRSNNPTEKSLQEREHERLLEEQQKQQLQGSMVKWRNTASSTAGTGSSTYSTTTKSTRNRNIIVNKYNPGSHNNTNYSSNSNSNIYNPNNSYNVRKTFTKHKNILVGNFNRTASSVSQPIDDDDLSSGSSADSNNFINNFFNTNWTTMFTGADRDRSSTSSSSRPSHKTHVEIITKNGATKKPNIIVNNYNPDVVTTTNNQHPYNSMSMMMSNSLPGRQDSNVHDSNNVVRAMYDRKITCMLYLQADHTFFQKMGSDESSIEAITRHVQRANSIYRNTDFNNDGKPDNITFMIKRIKVHNANALKDPGYRFPGNYGVEKFLELFSEEDYDAFCLAYMFTYRDFEMGTLGLAWTGDLKNAGGVCEKNGHYRGSLKSLNTGIVTLLNYGKHVPPAVSHVTLAHEIGHNFGSPHDPEQCTPGGEDGNYIMFARATSGDKRNNNKFSPCSLKSIEPVLNAKARSVKGCFTEPQTSICGNGVVEPGEQCDCGWEEDCKDSCCFPMSRHPGQGEKPCTLTPRAMCSPSQGPCCTTDCKLKFGDKCRDDNGCRDPSFCDGRMPQCPPSVNKPNKTICNKEFVCYMGDCTGSICLAYGLESCQCLPGPNDPKTKSCELCCKQPGEGNPCRSSFEWNEPPYDVPDMFAKPGTPCNDYNGYCDVFQKCREVDPSGPLATLRKLLLSEESIASFKKWIQTNWYTVVLAIVGVFVLLIISTKLLAKRSNLKLKSVTIIHSATTETVRLPDDNNGVIVHTAVRTKVPFKKKVRGERQNNKTKFVASKSANGNAGHKPMITSQQQQQQQNANGSSRSKSDHIKKPTRKKNRVAAPHGAVQSIPPVANLANATVPQTAATLPVDDHQHLQQKPIDAKKLKKTKAKQNKEIIDYSNRSGSNAVGSAGGHTNTFSKVHKWLLESPIVSQPLSHIEHSSKVRKVMSKSQSTPERLVQKSPQKTKSVGNLSNEKVKLQVVYKPPFKFSLRLSKNAKVKTHVIGGGALNKVKRKTRPSGDSKRIGAAPSLNAENSANKVCGERLKRAALLLRTSVEEEEDIRNLTLDEPNYETLNPKSPPSLENPFYENMQYTQVSEGHSSSAASKSANKVSRSSSKTNINGTAACSQPHSYSRSNSISTNNPFAAISNKHSSAMRKFSDPNSMNLSRNFGSTQNLIQPSQSNLTKSKKRSSLNLKSSSGTNANTSSKCVSKENPPPATRRSNSNLNMHRENSSSTNLRSMMSSSSRNDEMSTSNVVEPPLSGEQQQQPPLRRNSNNATSQQQQLLRSTRSSFSNIPRASLSASTAVNVSTNATPPPPSYSPPTVAAGGNSSFSNFSNQSISFSRQSPPTSASCDDPKRTPFGPHQLQHSSSGHSQGNNSSHSSSNHSSSHSNHDQTHYHRRSSRTGIVHNPPPPVGVQQHRSNSVKQKLVSVPVAHTRNHHHHSHHQVHLQQQQQQKHQQQQHLPSDLEIMVSDVENLVS